MIRTVANDEALLERFQALSRTASFNQWAGFEVVRAVEGEIDIRMPWRESDMGQYAGFLHAGLIAALLDTTCGFAAATIAGPVLASHIAVNCLAPAVGEEFVSLGRVVKMGRKQIFTTGEFWSVRDEVHKLVATANTMLVPTD